MVIFSCVNQVIGVRDMKKAISVVVADSSEGFRKLISEYIDAEEDMYVAAAAEDGIAAADRVSELRPDVLVTDLPLRMMEGLELIRVLKEREILPYTIVVSSFFTDRVAVMAGDLGVERFLPKPCRVEAIIECIRGCGRAAEQEGGLRTEEKGFCRSEWLRYIDEALAHCSIMSHLAGWRYLREALILAAEDREKLNGVTKVLYPELAGRFGTDSKNVERCIRNAIRLAWHGGGEERSAYFGTAAAALERRPGNVRFMKFIIEYIEKRYML